MWKIAPWLCAGIIIGIGLVSMSGSHLTAQQLESTRFTSPSCAYSNSSAFVCVADLDGNGQKEIIAGQNDGYSPNVQTTFTISYVNIINNTGTLRQQVCWVGNNSSSPPSVTCPPIIESSN